MASLPTFQPTDWLTALPEPQEPLAGWVTNNLHLVVQQELILLRAVELQEKLATRLLPDGNVTYTLLKGTVS